MALISLLTDYGLQDHYVSNLKAKIWSELGHINILDISHNVEKFHLPQAAYLLKSNIQYFCKDDVHIIDVCHAYLPSKFIIATSEKGIFIAPDNGILATLSIDFKDIVILEHYADSFNTLDHIIPLVVQIKNGATISSLGTKIEALALPYINKISISDDLIIGTISHVDSYGNLITDISKEAIELQQRGRDIEIKIGRERIKKISSNYKSGVEADCIAIFNSQQLLEIAITEANASKLLGKSFGDTVSVRFR